MYRRTKIGCAVATALTAATSGTANAQLEEIVVTATKRAQSMQDVAVAVTALTGDSIEQLGVSNFDEYVQYLPNVVQAGRAPGQSEIYIRGAATEQSAVTVSSVQGSAPSVALYQDEQPVSFGGRNLDVYTTDLARIEVLPGPQGTLFGSSSQSGTVRLISNKPNIDAFEAGFDTSFSSTRDGEASNSVEAYLNLPLSDKLAVRVAGYTDSKGGWIDNIQGFYNTNIEVMNRNQIFGAAICTGNPAVDSAGCTGRATVARSENSTLVEADFNDATYRGVRVSGLYDFNDDWSLLVQHTAQTLETEGVWEYDPNLSGESSVNRFVPVENQDMFGLTTWTLTGRLANLDVIYTGGFLDRDVESITDYTSYTHGGGYQVYYICAGGSYTGQAQCFDPTKQYKDNTDNTRFTNEFRVSTDPERRVRFTGGLYLDDVETNSEGQFQYLGAVEAGFNVSNAPGTLNGVPVEGVNDPRGRGPTTIFVNDFTRNEEQFAVFGELGFDLTDNVRATVGARYYDIDFELAGSTGSSFGCKGAATPCDGTNFDNRVSDRLEALGDFIENGTPIDASTLNGVSDTTVMLIEQGVANGTFTLDGLGADGVANQDDTIVRASLDWRPGGGDMLLFTTYSQGFRPQTVNRNAGTPAGNQTGVFQGFLVPAVARTDELDNFEIGLKGDFLDNRLRLNATAYFSEITDLQTTRFDPTNVAFLVFIENVGDAEINGLDGDFTWAATDNFTLSGAFSFVDSELTRLNPQLEGVAVPVGSELPFTPEFSGNIRARYDFELPVLDARGYVRGGINYTGERKAGIVGNAFLAEDVTRQVYNIASTSLEIAAEGGTFGNSIDPSTGNTFLNGRYVMESYSLVNLAFGVEKDNWSAELFVNNATNESAAIFINTQDYHPRVTTNRPREVGIRFSYDFE